MATIARLQVLLGANTSNFTSQMRDASNLSQRELRKMERQAKQLNESWNRNFKIAGAAVATGLALATKAAADFEKAMAEVSTLMDSTPEGMKRLGDSVKKMSVEFGQAPVDQAKALYQIISAGASDAATQMEQLEAANKLAVGGVTDVATAADGLTTVLNAYAGSGMSAQNVSDILFQTMRNGKTTIGELAGSIGNVATIAAQTGVGFEELGAAVGTLTKSGINTSQAMDAIRGVLSAVLKQSDQSVKMAEELGIAFNASALEARGLHGFLRDIANTGATSEQLSKLFGRVEGLNAVMALAAQDGAEFTRQLDSMGKAAGETDKAVAKMADSTSFKAAQARAAFETLKIEIGERFLAAVSEAAGLFVEYIDEIVVAVEALVFLLGGRLVTTAIASLVNMAAAGRGLAVAMAVLGGPIGIATTIIAGMTFAILKWLEAAEEAEAIANRLKSVGDGVTQAWVDAAGVDQLIARATELREAWIAADRLVMEARAKWMARPWDDDAEAEYSRLTSLQQQALDGLGRINRALAKHKEEADKASNSIGDINALIDEQVSLYDGWLVRKKKSATQTAAEIAATNRHKSAINEIDRLIDDMVDQYDDWTRGQDEYNRSLQSLLDRLYPAEAKVREFEAAVALLARASEEGEWTAERHADALIRLAEEMYGTERAAEEVEESVNAMSVAMDEGIRILERTFSDMWTNLLDGSLDVFDAVLDGFRSLISSMINEATTRKISLNIQQGIAGTGTGPNGGINWGALGTDLLQSLAVIGGGMIGGGGTGALMGSTIGALSSGFVASFAAAMSMGMGSSALWGTIATAFAGPLGPVIGAIIGGALGSLFDKERPPVLKIFGNQAGVGTSNSDKDRQFTTPFGTTFLSTRRIDSEGVQNVIDGVKQFDEIIAALLDSDTIAAITRDLKAWGSRMEGNQISMEKILQTRMDVVLANINDEIVRFVRAGSGLEEQIDRLGVGLAAQKIMDEFSSVFTGRSVTEFIDVVGKFRTGTMSMSDALKTVLPLLEQIVSAQSVLREYADLGALDQFNTLMATQGMRLADAVTTLQSALGDAIVSFDGSPEQLMAIADLAFQARQGELELLAQIDAIQKGLTQSLDDLRNEILGVGVEKRGYELFDEALKLIGAVNQAQTPEEIARLGQEFQALIRAISPEDQARMRSDIVAIIDMFQAAADSMLASMRATAESNAESTRDLVDIFLTDIGDPLDILASSNQQVAAELGSIDESINNLGPVIEESIRQGFGGANINVTVVVDRDGLVNE